MAGFTPPVPTKMIFFDQSVESVSVWRVGWQSYVHHLCLPLSFLFANLLPNPADCGWQCILHGSVEFAEVPVLFNHRGSRHLAPFLAGNDLCGELRLASMR